MIRTSILVCLTLAASANAKSLRGMAATEIANLTIAKNESLVLGNQIQDLSVLGRVANEGNLTIVDSGNGTTTKIDRVENKAGGTVTFGRRTLRGSAPIARKDTDA